MASDDEIEGWARALGAWWYRRVDLPSATVVSWSLEPGAAEALEGTLWRAECDLGEVLSLFGDGAFRDLSGDPLVDCGRVRPFHPADTDDAPDSMAVWMDRVLERSPPFQQFGRCDGAPRWDGQHARFDRITSLALTQELAERGWREDGRARLALVLPALGVRVVLALHPRALFDEPEDPSIRYTGRVWAELSRETGLLTDAMSQEIAVDVLRAGGRRGA